MKKLLVLLIACLALTLAACGDDDDDDAGAPTPPTTPTEQTDTGAAQKPSGGETAAVDIPEITFEPADLTVKPGTTITWTNSDDIPHTVTKEGGPGGDFDSGDIAPGDTFELTADVPGKVDYVCTIHPGQAGTFTVK